jgi:hypothetical protein
MPSRSQARLAIREKELGSATIRRRHPREAGQPL